MTWKDIKAAIEAQGVVETTDVHAIHLLSGMPILVWCAPGEPECAIIHCEYQTGLTTFPIPIPPEVP